MGCCKCEEYKWPDPQNVVWKDEEGDGMEYCVFHAPNKNTIINLDMFEEKLWRRINDFAARGMFQEACCLRGSIFPEGTSLMQNGVIKCMPPLDLMQTTLNNCINISRVSFSSKINFKEAEFGDNTTFHKTSFENTVNFCRTLFGDSTNFDRVSFGKWTSFYQTRLGKWTNFYKATFADETDCVRLIIGNESSFEKTSFGKRSDFKWATFGDRTDFTKASFGDLADFRSAKFGTMAHFERTTFGNNTNFSKSMFDNDAAFFMVNFGSNSNFYNTIFSGLTVFNNSSFGEHTSFIKTHFRGGAYFFHTDIKDNVHFTETHFHQPSSFYGAQFGKQVIFSKCHFHKPTLFRNPLAIEDLRFQDMTIEQFQNVDFLNCPLKNITFTNVEWPRHPTEDRYCIPMEAKPSKLPAVADFYRQMKKRCRDEQNDAEASLWHYAEKEATLKLLQLNPDATWAACRNSITDAFKASRSADTNPNVPSGLLNTCKEVFSNDTVKKTTSATFSRVLLEVYRIISRYGEDPKQAILVLLVLAAALLCVVLAGAAFAPSPADPAKALDASRTFHVFFQYLLLDRPSYDIQPIFAGLALLLSRLLIPIQAAIFAFALRNKLHR